MTSAKIFALQSGMTAVVLFCCIFNPTPLNMVCTAFCIVFTAYAIKQWRS